MPEPLLAELVAHFGSELHWTVYPETLAVLAALRGGGLEARRRLELGLDAPVPPRAPRARGRRGRRRRLGARRASASPRAGSSTRPCGAPASPTRRRCTWATRSRTTTTAPATRAFAPCSSTARGRARGGRRGDSAPSTRSRAACSPGRLARPRRTRHAGRVRASSSCSGRRASSSSRRASRSPGTGISSARSPRGTSRSSGVGAIIGAGILSSLGTGLAGGFDSSYGVTRPAAGPALVVSFLLTAVACGFTGFCYAEMASMIPVSGSAYTYAYATLGELMAWIIGWDLLLEYAISNVAIAISWGSYANNLLARDGRHICRAGSRWTAARCCRSRRSS